jgi:hypothetical protein
MARRRPIIVALVVALAFSPFGLAGAASSATGSSTTGHPGQVGIPGTDATQSASTRRTLTCANNTGGGNGRVASNVLSLAGVAFLGVFRDVSGSVERLPTGLYWEKSYIEIPRVRNGKVAVVVTVRRISGSNVGLSWGDQSTVTTSTRADSLSSPRSVLKIQQLRLQLCGTSAGFPGGFVFAGPTSCVQLTVSQGSSHATSRLSFGGLPCPA